jgi:hypothetical protein
MKRMLVVLIALAVIFSIGTANAASINPEQKRPSAAIGLYTLWWPTAIDLNVPATGQDLTCMLVISIFYLDEITVNVTLTACSNDPTNSQTTKTFKIAPVCKLYLFPSNFGFLNTIADIWVTSPDAPIFGGTLYLLNGNNLSVITTVPHIELENIS